MGFTVAESPPFPRLKGGLWSPLFSLLDAIGNAEDGRVAATVASLGGKAEGSKDCEQPPDRADLYVKVFAKSLLADVGRAALDVHVPEHDQPPELEGGRRDIRRADPPHEGDAGLFELGGGHDCPPLLVAM
jgi:hypothetical protein